MRSLAMFLCGLVAFSSISGCSRGRAPEQGDEKTDDSEMNRAPASEWIVFEKSGGIAGFHFVLQLDSEGAWHAVDKARPDSLRGQFSAEEIAALVAEMAAVPESEWKTYSSKVYDDFQFQVTRRDRWGVRRMDGNDQALPESWRPIIHRLAAPFTELMMRR